MQYFRLVCLILLSCLLGGLTLARPTVIFASDARSPAATASFKEIYDAAINSRQGHETEVDREANQAAREHKYVEATAKYLAAATQPFTQGNFERARPTLDKAFLTAAKIPVADQKEMLSTLSVIVGNTRDIHDYDIWKYLAQQRLNLMQKQPGTTAAERYTAIQTLAFSCSKHKRYKEAEALLLETLQDLQSIKPVPANVGWCESTLAHVYEDAGDLERAKQYYSQWAQFAREINNSDQLTRALQEYTEFLIKHQIFKEAVPVADEYFKQATSPEQARWRDRVPFGLIARGLADIDVNEADKYYRAAFENEKAMTAYAMNAGYGQTICEWAEMLNKHGRTSEAISVLNDGMAFCRSSKWPDALESYMPQMADKCEQLLRAAGRTTEATDLRASFVKEMASHKDSLAQAKEQQLSDTMSNPNSRPVQKVSALTEMAYRSFDVSKCEEAMKYLDKALRIYENNANSKDSPQMYGYFRDIALRLSKCGRAQDSKAILLRIVKARVAYGFPDPDTMGLRSHCGGREPVDAFDELFPARSLWDRSKVAPTEEALLKQLLADAKTTGKLPTVVYLLTRLTEYQSTDEEKVASLEELELWKAKESNPQVLLQSMMRTADMYMHLKQYNKLMDKCKAAIAVAEKADGPNKNIGCSGSLEMFANGLINNNQLDKAEELYIAGYKSSLHERGDYSSLRLMSDIEQFANKYRLSNDVESGAKLLQTALDMTKAELGEDGTLTRAWLMKLSSYYVLAGEHEKAKRMSQELIASVTKPGMSIAKTTSDDMTVLARLLREKGYSTEAGKIENRLKVLDYQQCAVH